MDLIGKTMVFLAKTTIFLAKTMVKPMFFFFFPVFSLESPKPLLPFFGAGTASSQSEMLNLVQQAKPQSSLCLGSGASKAAAAGRWLTKMPTLDRRFWEPFTKAGCF